MNEEIYMIHPRVPKGTYFNELTLSYLLKLIESNFNEEYDDGLAIYCLMRTKLEDDELQQINNYALLCSILDNNSSELFEEIYLIEEYILDMYCNKYHFRVALKDTEYVHCVLNYMK